MDSERC
jgi:two-component sensor histidine kinase